MPAQFTEGRYNITLIDSTIEPGKFGEQIVIRFTEDETGKEQTLWMPLTDEKGDRSEYAQKTLQAARHIGLDDNRIGRFHHEHPERIVLEGVRCEGYATVKSKGDGDSYNRWYVNVPRENVPIAGDALRRLDAMFGKELKDMGCVAKPKPKPQPAPEQAPQEPEGIPVDEPPPSGLDIPF